MDALPLEWAKHTARAQPQAPGIQPDLGIFYRDQAIQLSQQDRFAEAESAAREALRHRPEDVDITNELGVVVWRQGRSAEAEEIYRRALELAPDDFRVLTN